MLDPIRVDAPDAVSADLLARARCAGVHAAVIADADGHAVIFAGEGDRRRLLVAVIRAATTWLHDAGLDATTISVGGHEYRLLVGGRIATRVDD